MSKQDCLLAACDASLGRLFEGLEQAIAAEPDWAQGVRRGLRALLERTAAEPQLARVWFVELHAVNVAGAERHAVAIDRLAVALRPPGGNSASITRVRDQIIAGGVWHTIGAQSSAILSALCRNCFRPCITTCSSTTAAGHGRRR